MWSPRRARVMLRRTVLAAAVLLLSACGFRPLYATGGVADVSEELSQIEVAVIPDRPGQILRNYLIQGLNGGGRPAQPAYASSG